MASNVQQCDVCSEDGTYLEADNWCSECQQWLCLNCSKYHKRLATTKSHVLLTTNDFHKIPKSMSEIERKCRKHPENELEFYCGDHIAIICFCCMKTDHSCCKAIHKVNDVARGVKSSAAVAELFSKIEDYIKTFKDLEADRVNRLGNLSRSTNQINADIKALLDDLQKNLQRAATDLQIDLQTKLRGESLVLETQRDMFMNKRSQLEQKLCDLKNMVTYASDVQMFLSLEQLNTDITVHEKNLQDLDNQIFSKTFGIEINEHVLRFMGTNCLFGRVTIKSEKCAITFKGKNKAMVHVQQNKAPISGLASGISSLGLNSQQTTLTKAKFRFVRKITIPTPRVNGKKNFIRDMKCLPNGYIALTDMGNDRIVILDQNGSVMLEDRLPSSPRCLAFTTDGRVAVTLYNQKEVIIWNPYNPSDKRTIDVEDFCTGITCVDNSLVINCQKTGLLLINIKDNSRARRHFWTGRFDMYHHKNGYVYIHKAKTNDFMLVDVLNGKEIDKIKVYSKTQSCIAMDEYDNFYIVDKNSIRKIELNKKTSEVVLDESEGITTPQAVATYFETKKSSPITKMFLLVAAGDGNSIFVFERK